jgi:copper chaperone NosL
MSVSDARFAAQLVAPAEEPLFFDDIGCLRDYLGADAERVHERAVAYVADHVSKAWVVAAVAAYCHCPHLQTPMDSHLLAHADPGARAADASAAGCRTMTAAEVFGAVSPPAGAPL